MRIETRSLSAALTLLLMLASGPAPLDCSIG